MRYFPTKDDDKEVARLAPETWMLAQLKFNPSYVSWGPHEDYMWKTGEGWDKPWINKSWPEFGPSELNELNEVVNFYFSVERPGEDCTTCGGNGTHPDAQWISESFYEHSSPFRDETTDAKYAESQAVLRSFGCEFKVPIIQRGSLPPEKLLKRYGKPFMDCCARIMEHGGYWDDDITDDEALALVAAGRGKCDKLSTATDFNRANAHGSRAFLGSHDAINRWIVIEQRLKRLGMPQHCETCEGHGSLFTGPARLDLTLWMLHPRKGCSRGVEVQDIQEHELPAVYAYLSEAAQRNASRFGKLPKIKRPQKVRHA